MTKQTWARMLGVFVAFLLLGMQAQTSYAWGLDDLVDSARSVQKAVDTGKDLHRQVDKAKKGTSSGKATTSSGNATQQSQTAAGSSQAQESNVGVIVFSTKPINPDSPADLTNSFQAGQQIYALATGKASWRKLTKGGNKKQIEVMMMGFVDGKQVMGQYLTMKTPELSDSDRMPFEVAPSMDNLTTYFNPDMSLAKGRGNRRIGAQQMTYNLGKLAPGAHTIKLQFFYYGDVLAEGVFTITGDDYSYYAQLNKEIDGMLAKGVTMPPAKLQNQQLEQNMRKLLADAGWSTITRLNIIDKDWWLDRKSGGNSPIVSRHIAAAVAAPDGGNYYYKVVTFHQYKTISGAFGPLEISHTGPAHAVPAANIDK